MFCAPSDAQRMTCGRQDLEARSHWSATGGKYVTRYFEENAKKYRESPDKTGLCGGAGWESAGRRGRIESSDVCASMHTVAGKIFG
ncbi:hypothetical protein HT746_31685 [Burkholderia pyrrocinia]|uniref:hypothetical protein n=1 Tax=Burkholderia pyrrocinia TaxID=60550 RepID=UPI0015771462|nr:hypothetical protein [Burkholderia pyrrocinia]NTX31625.1 hypothetical protein [Burkholderia pyrrocinia]QVN20602.1 hypothetical protein JYG32_28970 [Burkholderia pyrrocinia]